jgi:hypothetical protein
MLWAPTGDSLSLFDPSFPEFIQPHGHLEQINRDIQAQAKKTLTSIFKTRYESYSFKQGTSREKNIKEFYVNFNTMRISGIRLGRKRIIDNVGSRCSLFLKNIEKVIKVADRVDMDMGVLYKCMATVDIDMLKNVPADRLVVNRGISKYSLSGKFDDAIDERKRLIEHGLIGTRGEILDIKKVRLYLLGLYKLNSNLNPLLKKKIAHGL